MEIGENGVHILHALKHVAMEICQGLEFVTILLHLEMVRIVLVLKYKVGLVMKMLVRVCNTNYMKQTNMIQ